MGSELKLNYAGHAAVLQRIGCGENIPHVYLKLIRNKCSSGEHGSTVRVMETQRERRSSGKKEAWFPYSGKVNFF